MGKVTFTSELDNEEYEVSDPDEFDSFDEVESTEVDSTVGAPE